MQAQLIEQLTMLRLRGMASALEESLTALSQKKLAPTSWLGQLLSAEIADRQARSYRSAALLEAVRVVTGFDDIAAVRESIEQRRGHLWVPEHVAPFPEGQIGRHDERDALVELADQVEEQRTTILGERIATG